METEICLFEITSCICLILVFYLLKVLACQVSWDYVICIRCYFVNVNYFTVCFPCSWQNHHLSLKYDFHSYMVRSMEEEFQRIVGVRLVIVEIQQSLLLQLRRQILVIQYNKTSCALLCTVILISENDQRFN